MENIFLHWDEFKKGKLNKFDVIEFERNLEDNIFDLHGELANRTYKHGTYKEFHIYDPKHRIIHKATIKDRLVHHMIFKELDEIFDSNFIYHSYSSRNNKGVHLAVKNLFCALRKASKNHTKPVYALKCDIRKFFHSISHQKLFEIIKNKVEDPLFLWLIWEIISSFSILDTNNFPQRERAKRNFWARKGLPIGNLTSQIFANIFLDKFDWFIKKQLRIRYYFRYADDFIIVHSDAAYLEKITILIEEFLKTKLNLELHPRKIQIRKLKQGVDFLGYVILPHYTALRTKTKKRMFKKIKLNKEKLKQGIISEESFSQSMQSYYGMLKHCNGYKLKAKLANL